MAKPTGQGLSSGHSSNPLMRHSGQSNSTASKSNNPLMRKSGQSSSKANASNPMMQNNRQAGSKGGNPLNRGAEQNGRNGNMAGKGNMATRGNTNLGHNPGGANQGRFANRGYNRSWRHGEHANYHVRSSREVFRNYHAVRHDRYWYHSHYDRVVVVGGGYYYWDAGYWYPAWGYDPAYAYYVYDGPIYSYNNLPPDQVTMDVQTALQDEGYYTGEIDGMVGPKTREALGAYQSDHNLDVTSAIDEPTVDALGLTANT